MFPYICTYRHTNIDTKIHWYTHTCRRTYVHTYIPTYLHLHTCIPAYLHSKHVPSGGLKLVWNWSETGLKPHLSLQLWPGERESQSYRSFSHKNVHAFSHIYRLTYLLTYIHTCIHAYILTYLHTYKHIYIHTYFSPLVAHLSPLNARFLVFRAFKGKICATKGKNLASYMHT